MSLVVPYDPEWPRRFAEIRGVIQRAIPGTYHSVEHVGSTSVPGMTAKPIIDIDIVMREGQFERIKRGLEALGYVDEGDNGIAGREAFRLTDPGLKGALAEHHLYVCDAGSAELRRHRAFRDYLLAHPSQIERFSARKREIAASVGDHREAYQEAKAAIVDEILALALEDTR